MKSHELPIYVLLKQTDKHSPCLCMRYQNILLMQTRENLVHIHVYIYVLIYLVLTGLLIPTWAS